MATVPVYESQVRQAPLPDAQVNLRVTPDDFGGQVAQGADQLAVGVERYAKKQDLARSMDASTTMDQWDDLAVYDPQKGALYTRKGKDAAGMTDEYMAARDAAVQATRAGLANDDQRAQFDRLQARKREVIQHTLSSHEDKQNEAWATSSAVAKIDSAAAD